MPRTMLVLIFSAAMLATGGFADTNGLIAVPTPLAGNAGSVIHWDKFYDRSGNLLPGEPGDAVGTDSLYWKDYSSTTHLKSSAKAQDPSPADRTAMSFHNASSTTCMDPTGDYVYEVDGTSLYRFSTVNGAMTTYSLSYTGGLGCATDGQYIYRPNGTTMYKYTMTGTYVNSTTTNYSCDAYTISCCRDTVWLTDDRYTGVNLYGYACSKFTGGSISNDATWNVGTGTNGVGNVAWDGDYYYVPWIGTHPITFKRFYADRTLYSTGTVSIDPRSVMSSVLSRRQVAQDSLYWKLITSATNLYSSPKAQDATPDQPTPLAWQNSQSVSCMTPDGHYTFEVSGTNMRRTDLSTGAVANYTLANAGEGTCGTDGQYVYVPNGTTMRKYSLTGVLVSTTTMNYAPRIGYSFGVANDTVWLTPADTGTTWYGYACSNFTGGSITNDATWATAGGGHVGMTVAYDGQYYYMTWGGTSSNTLLRFYGDRTLYSTGTVTGDARSVMCKTLRPLMIVSTDAESYRAELAETLKVASGGILDGIGTYDVGTNATFPATEWYNGGCRVILEFSGSPLPNDPILLGDSLAKFVDLGGRVVTAVWADAGAANLAGRYVSQYMPFTSQTNPGVAGSMGTVHDPLHPIMEGVTAISVSSAITGNTHSTLRSPNCVCLAEWDSGNRSVAAYLDSADVRLASVGFAPFTVYSGATGQWAKLLVNAILWVWPGMPTINVTAPDTGSVWDVGSSHDITWTAANGPITKDSIVYSNDNGATWNFVDKHSGSRTSYAWTIPNSPSTDCYVRVFSWNAIGSASGVSGRFEIEPAGGIEQPENNALPLAFALYQSYPNPSAAGAQLRYALPRPAQVELRIYDVAGTLVRRLVDGVQPAGYRHAYWNGCDDRGRRVAPGVYYCRFRAGDFTAAQKLVVRR